MASRGCRHTPRPKMQVHTRPCTPAALLPLTPVLLTRLSLCTARAAGCQRHRAHVLIAIHLQAFFLWHHSKDCIQVQHNLTRYEEGLKAALCSKETLPCCLLVISLIPARTVFT